MQPFIYLETKNLRTLRNITLGIILLIDLGILAFFIHAMYAVHQERRLQVNFLVYSFETILYIQLALSLFFVPLLGVIYRRFRFILMELNDLKEEYALLYKDYCNRIPRLFSTLPQYLISQKGLLVFKNLKPVTIRPEAIHRICIRRIDLGRFGKKCKVIIQDTNERRTTITYSSRYPEEVEFLTQHIRFINRCIVLEEET